MRFTRTNSRKPPRQNRGSIYVAILGLSLLVAAIGVGGLAITRIQSRTNDLRNDIQEARSYAQSAIELARACIALDRTWRTDYTNGAWFTNQAFANGSFSLTVQNPNGALNNSDTDPVILTATGAKGAAVQTIQVTLNMTLVPVGCLNTSISAGSINFQNATVTGAGSTVASLSTITAAGANIYPNVYAAGLIVGTQFNNIASSNSAAPTMPDSHVFDYYIANGTPISVGSLNNKQIDQTLLSPSNNPYGATNPKGIYVLDCQNNTVNIQNSRIIGTLVILNPGPNSQLQKSVNWQPAVTNYPCLMVRGDFTIQPDSGPLNESPAKNFNPAGSPYPYPNGTANATVTDSFPSIINGFVYISGNLSAMKNTSVDTLIVGGVLTTQNTVAMTFSPVFNSSPPPGFYSVQMTPAIGSWLQVVH